MLGFFRRYEKTFLLVLFAPALLSLGVTGAMISVIESPGDVVVGRIYGEEVTAKEFQEVSRLYAQTSRLADEESTWRFYAFLKAAERNGIDVAPAEVGEDIRSRFVWEIAQDRAQKEIEAQDIDTSTPEGQEEFNRIFMQYVQDPPEFDQELYEEILEERRGRGSRRDYEEQQIRQARVSRLLDMVRDLAVVDPDEVWEEFQEQNHLRVLELVAVDPAEHAPDPAVEDPESPHHVSDAQVRDYYEANEPDYDVPRRVDLEFVAIDASRVKDATWSAATADGAAEDALWADMEAYYAGHVAQIGTSVAFADLPEGTIDDLREAVIDERTTDRLDAVMDAVADRVLAAEAEGKRADLAAIRDAVQGELDSSALVYGSTGLIPQDELEGHADIGSFAAVRWFQATYDQDEVSDVLAGPNGWFVLRSRKIEASRTPSYAEVEAKVRDDYADGSLAEQERYYAAHPDEFRTKPGFRVDWVTVTDDAFPDAEDPHAAAREALEEALAVSRDEGWEPGFPFTRFTSETLVSQGAKFEKDAAEIPGTELDDHPVVGGAAVKIRTMSPRQYRKALPAAPVERKDGAGWVLYRVTGELPAEVAPFEEVQEEVAGEIRLERGLDRAETWAYGALDELADLTGDALAAKLAELDLDVQKTAPVDRDARELEGIARGNELVAAAFAAGAEVGGAYADVWRGDDAVYLYRVAERVDAPADAYEEQYPALRRDLLSKARGDYASKKNQEILLEAKGIPDELIGYSRGLRDGPDGVTGLELRQVFLPADASIIDRWLADAARERIAEVVAALEGGQSWALVVDQYSEDENTRRLQGELPPVRRGELGEAYGTAFEEAVFDLPLDAVSDPIESERGWHVVRKLRRREGKTVFAHVLIQTDPELRQMPDSVREEAEAASREALEAALARIEGGEAFRVVAQEVGDFDDPWGQGAPFEVDWATPFELAALEQPLDWEPPRGSDDVGDLDWMPEAVRIDDEWHFFACGRSRLDQRAAWDAGAARDRDVYHVVTEDEGAMDDARGEMEDWLVEWVEDEEDRPTWGSIRDRFAELAADYSVAPSKEKSGAVGAVVAGEAAKRYGVRFLRELCGELPEAGQRLAIFQSDAGFHLVEVVDVVKPKDDVDRVSEVRDLVLRGTDWK